MMYLHGTIVKYKTAKQGKRFAEDENLPGRDIYCRIINVMQLVIL
jgi:hypothetical protein